MNKRLVAIILIIAVAVGVVASFHYLKASGVGKEYSEQFFAMDTVMDIKVISTATSDMASDELISLLKDRIYEMEREFSTTVSGSDIDKLNSSDGETVAVSEDTYKLLSKAIAVAVETDGLFDPTIYPVVLLWGFTTGEYKVPSDSEINDALKNVGYDRIHLLGQEVSSYKYDDTISTDEAVGSDRSNYLVSVDKGTKLDLGACAKGYLSDELCRIIREHGYNGIVSLGGNVQSVGYKSDGDSFIVGIKDPLDDTKLYDKVESSDDAVVTSGNYERYFEKDGVRYHHIMDVRTGAPADNTLASVTVIGRSGFMCDAYATAMYVMGEDKAIEFAYLHDSYRFILIRKDGSSFDSTKDN